jgi:hypothetical protein
MQRSMLSNEGHGDACGPGGELRFPRGCERLCSRARDARSGRHASAPIDRAQTPASLWRSSRKSTRVWRTWCSSFASTCPASAGAPASTRERHSCRRSPRVQLAWTSGTLVDRHMVVSELLVSHMRYGAPPATVRLVGGRSDEPSGSASTVGSSPRAGSTWVAASDCTATAVRGLMISDHARREVRPAPEGLVGGAAGGAVGHGRGRRWSA